MSYTTKNRPKKRSDNTNTLKRYNTVECEKIFGFRGGSTDRRSWDIVEPGLRVGGNRKTRLKDDNKGEYRRQDRSNRKNKKSLSGPYGDGVPETWMVKMTDLSRQTSIGVPTEVSETVQRRVHDRRDSPPLRNGLVGVWGIGGGDKLKRGVVNGGMIYTQSKGNNSFVL